MAYRPAKVAHVVRDVVSDAIANRISDPRVQRFTSVTRVEVSGDLRFADVHVSVMGTEPESQTTMKGLESARGMIQSRLAKRLDLRLCPVIRFHLDLGIKIGVETVRKLDELMAESQGGRPGSSGEQRGETNEGAGAESEEDQGAAPASGAD